MFISFKIIEEIVIKLYFVVFASLLHPKCVYGYPHSTLIENLVLKIVTFHTIVASLFAFVPDLHSLLDDFVCLQHWDSLLITL